MELSWMPLATIDSGSNSLTFIDSGVSFLAADAVSLAFIDSAAAEQPRVFHRLRIELTK